jgi:tetratricopeptide (TPR) repeat protein
MAEDWRNLKRITDEGLLYYPRSADLWNFRSSYYFFNKAEPFEIRKLEALQSAEIAHELDPSGVNASNVAWILMYMWKHYYSALPYLREAENLNYQEEKPELYYWMGVCYEQVAYINEASVYYNLFLDNAPFHTLADDARNRLENLFFK